MDLAPPAYLRESSPTCANRRARSGRGSRRTAFATSTRSWCAWSCSRRRCGSDRETHGTLYAAADDAAQALEIDAPITLYQAPGANGANAALWFMPGEAHVILVDPSPRPCPLKSCARSWATSWATTASGRNRTERFTSRTRWWPAWRATAARNPASPQRAPAAAERGGVCRSRCAPRGGRAGAGRDLPGQGGDRAGPGQRRRLPGAGGRDLRPRRAGHGRASPTPRPSFARARCRCGRVGIRTPTSSCDGCWRACRPSRRWTSWARCG